MTHHKPTRRVLRILVTFTLGLFLLAVVDIALSLTPFDVIYAHYHTLSSIIFLVWVAVIATVVCWWVLRQSRRF